MAITEEEYGVDKYSWNAQSSNDDLHSARRDDNALSISNEKELEMKEEEMVDENKIKEEVMEEKEEEQEQVGVISGTESFKEKEEEEEEEMEQDAKGENGSAFPPHGGEIASPIEPSSPISTQLDHDEHSQNELVVQRRIIPQNLNFGLFIMLMADINQHQHSIQEMLLPKPVQAIYVTLQYNLAHCPSCHLKAC